MSDRAVERLLEEAQQQPFSGWDFSYLKGRRHEQYTSWNYSDLLRPKLDAAPAVLDLGTGGGELLASLAPLPSRTIATEGYPPNLELARARLGPLGVEVVAYSADKGNAQMFPGEGAGSMPFPDGSFPLVIDRHESYFPAEIFRVVASGGQFITQQVGGRNLEGLNQALGVPTSNSQDWTLEFAVDQLETAGFTIDRRGEEYPTIVFSDVGAVAYYLKVVPWQIEGFSIEKYRERLIGLQTRIEAEGGLHLTGHYFYIEASKP